MQDLFKVETSLLSKKIVVGVFVWVHLLLEALDSHMWCHLVVFKTYKKECISWY